LRQRACRRGPAGVRVTDTLHFPEEGRTLQVKEPAQGFPLGSGRELRGRHARRRYRITLALLQPLLRRAIVVPMSAQGQAVPDIARLLDRSQEYMRGVIHAFNDVGFKALDPKWSGGRSRTINEQARRQICLIARCRPRDLGLAFSAWSLTKLAEYAVDTGVVASVSRESIRQILRSGGDQLAGHQDLEGLHRPRLHRQDAPGPGPV
jgi:transposase